MLSVESTDSLSFYDELINSGQTDGDAFIVDIDDQKTEQLVAISVLQDKSKYKVIKNIQ